MSEAPEDDIPHADLAEQEAPQSDSEPGLSVEDRALSMGWTPQSQFKGDPEKWVDAETFVKRGEEFLPFLKATNRRLERELEKATAKLDKMDEALKGAIQHISKADQRAYTRARAELEAELEQYAAQGNTEAVKQVTRDIVDLDREITAAARPQAVASDTPPEMMEWLEANAWYGKDKALTAACQAIADDVFEEGFSGKAQLKEVDRRLREEFPAKFQKPENPNRRGPAAVEGVGAGPRTRGRSYSDLPSDAKDMWDEFVRTIKGFSREKYVREYFASEDRK